MASVAKWLRQRIVVPPLGGSSPLVRPGFRSQESRVTEVDQSGTAD